MDFSARFSLRRNRAFFWFSRGGGRKTKNQEAGGSGKVSPSQNTSCVVRGVCAGAVKKNPDVRQHLKPMPSPVLTTKVAVLEWHARSRFGIFGHSKKIFEIH